MGNHLISPGVAFVEDEANLVWKILLRNVGKPSLVAWIWKALEVGLEAAERVQHVYSRFFGTKKHRGKPMSWTGTGFKHFCGHFFFPSKNLCQQKKVQQVRCARPL